MKENRLSAILLTALLAAALLVRMMIQAFAPRLILPRADLPMVVALSWLVLLLEYFIHPVPRRSYVGAFFFAGAAFLLLPWAAGVASGRAIVEHGMMGGATFLAVALLFDSAMDRARMLPGRRIAAVANGFVLYLAAQGFSGVFLS